MWGQKKDEAKSFADHLKDVASRANLQVVVVSPTFVRCGFNLPGGRSQVVHCMPVGDLGGQTVVQISTPVAELPSGFLPGEVADGLLKANGSFKIGSFGIVEGSGKKMLLLSHNLTLETLVPEEFRIVVMALAATGDEWERKLGDGDRF